MIEKKSPIVSVVVPIYKVEPYLSRCVMSILQQSYSFLDVILVDDGSPDKCPQICDDFAAKDPRIKVIHKENGGLSDARNMGIGCALGEYITFVDSDDCIHPELVESLLKLIQENNAEIAVGDFVDFVNEPPMTSSEGEFFQGVYSPRDAIFQLYVKSSHRKIQFVTAWGKLYKTHLFETIRYPVGRVHEDAYTTYKAYALATKIAYIDKPLYFYFLRPSSIMGRGFSLKSLDIIPALQERLQFFKERGDQELYNLELLHLLRTSLSLYWKCRLVDSKEASILRALIRSLQAPKAMPPWVTKRQTIVWTIYAKCPSLYRLRRIF